MGIKKVKATQAQCDGCGRVQLGTEDAPVEGLYINWTEVSSAGADGGKMFVCDTECAAVAMGRRHEIEGENRRG